MITDLFTNGSYWQSGAAVSPPPFWTEEAGFYFATDSAAVGDSHMVFVGDYTILPGTYTLNLQVTSNSLEQELFCIIQYSIGVNGFTLPFSLSDAYASATEIEFTLPAGVTLFSVHVYKKTGASTYGPPSYMASVLTPPDVMNGPALLNGGSSDYNRSLCYDSPVDYDNGRFVDPRAQTLAELRTRLLVRLGYAAQAASPPPGMASLLSDFLNSANLELYERYPVMRLQRWWTWQTAPGRRFYDVLVDCTDYLDVRHITQAWLQDDMAWFPLVAGISPALYNQVFLSLPQYYELRDTIELWPVPDKATYLVHFKGNAGPSLLTLDSDTTAVDAHAVFLHALAAAKAHYGQPDATRYDRQLEIYIGRLNAGAHYTKRYIPGESPAVGLPLPIRQVPGG